MAIRDMPASCCRVSHILCWLGAVLMVPALPAEAVDVQFHIIPLLTPSSTTTTIALPTAVSSIPRGSVWTAEIWGSDLQDATYGSTGLIAAYLDVLYSPAKFPTVSAYHSSLFPAFLGTEPTIDTAQGRILNLGGVTPRLDLPQGIAPEWVRIGWVQFGGIDVPSPTNVHITGTKGAGGIGCYGRVCGSVEVIGSDVVIAPEPLSGAMLVIVLTTVCGAGRKKRRDCTVGTPRSSSLGWHEVRPSGPAT